MFLLIIAHLWPSSPALRYDLKYLQLFRMEMAYLSFLLHTPKINTINNRGEYAPGGFSQGMHVYVFLPSLQYNFFPDMIKDVSIRNTIHKKVYHSFYFHTLPSEPI